MRKMFLLLILTSMVKAQSNALSTLIKGIQSDNISLVKDILDSKKADVNTTFSFTYGTEVRQITPLMLAVLVSNQPMAELLLNQGANISAIDNTGTTVLMYALRPGNESMFLELLKRNAPVDLARKDGITILMMASAWGYDTLVDAIIKDAQQKGILEKLLIAVDKNGKKAFDYAKNNSTKELLQKVSPVTMTLPQPTPTSSSSTPSTEQPTIPLTQFPLSLSEQVSLPATPPVTPAPIAAPTPTQPQFSSLPTVPPEIALTLPTIPSS